MGAGRKKELVGRWEKTADGFEGKYRKVYFPGQFRPEGLLEKVGDVALCWSDGGVFELVVKRGSKVVRKYMGGE